MSEFIVDEQGCENLIQYIEEQLKSIALIDSALADSLPMLRQALGEDYEGIHNSVKAISAQLADANNNLKIMHSSMNAYIARVKQVRVILN